MSGNDENWLSLGEFHQTAGPPPDRSPADAPSEFVRQRLCSLDAYRGLIMISLAFAGFGLAATARNHLAGEPAHEFWEQVETQFTHVEWVGCSYWDLIQPSFMFMVGVSVAYSYAKRRRLGQSYLSMLAHAAWRALALTALGIFLISNWQEATNWSLVNVLTQIGLGYVFLFLLWGRSYRTQAEAAAVLLFGVWLLYYFYPQAGVSLSSGAVAVGVPAEWAQQHLQEIGPAWHKNANVGHAVDVWLLNQLPRREPFEYNAGGYQTINFIPSLATMVFGLMCGELLRSRFSAASKLLVLIAAGAAGIALGVLLDASGYCPLVKRIWTPSFALYSTGWCCLILAALYTVFDLLPFGFLAFPLVVVGVNSLAIYVMSMLLQPWVARTLETHLGDQVFQLRARFGSSLYRLAFVDEPTEQIIALYQPTIQAVMVGLVFWLICWWMYRQRIFVRL